MTEPDPYDYTEAVVPEEPTPEYIWAESDDTGEFIPDEPAEIFELLPSKGKRKRLKSTTGKAAA